MDLNEARTIVTTLAQGIDPTTGEAFGPDSPYNDPKVIRALFRICQSGRGTPPPKLTLEERQQRNLDLGRPRNANLPWTAEARARVASDFRDGRSVQELAATLERSRSSIVAELLRQDLVPPELR